MYFLALNGEAPGRLKLGILGSRCGRKCGQKFPPPKISFPLFVKTATWLCVVVNKNRLQVFPATGNSKYITVLCLGFGLGQQYCQTLWVKNLPLTYQYQLC